MTKSIVALLRARIDALIQDDSNTARLRIDTLTKLLDIAEAVAADDPILSNGILDAEEWWCVYCDRTSIEDASEVVHAPNCPKRLADELCGKGDD